MPKEIIQTNLAPAPIGPYNQAVKANGFIFISGQIALDPVTGDTVTTSIEEETHLVMKNIAAILAEAKISEIIEIDKILDLDPLSLEYDNLSILKPYKTRVKGALLTLLFFEKLKQNKFNFISQESIDYIVNLAKKVEKFTKIGLESNQIFMLMFSESIDQSIKSDSGSNYEDRIFYILNKIGIKNIAKTHDKNDKSTEYDFFFEIDGKIFGVGAKRTLRERYKQFIKTAITSKIDVSIEITLGTDLNEEKARTIASHGSFIFVSDEIYQSREFLKNNEQVFSVKDLNIETLKKIGSRQF